MKTLFLANITIAFLISFAAQAGGKNTKSHGLSAFGDLKYKPFFKNFDYVNPRAPRGGTLRLWGLDSFDSVNPYILKGVPANNIGLIHGSLMERAMDEPDALYGLIAEDVSFSVDRRNITFYIRKTAKFSDGTPITAEDAVFTFKTLIRSGHPKYRFILADVASAKAVGKFKVKYKLRTSANRNLPLQIAALPVLPKNYYRKINFAKTTMQPPPGAGPYKVDKIVPGKSITYRRIKNHWSQNLPVMLGRYNFEKIRIDYYRDRDVAFQAFFSNAYDFREEFTSRTWATQYDQKQQIKDRRVLKMTLPDFTPSGVQGFFFNMRLHKFKDRRVRAALDLAFDFEWTNKTLFHGLYKRTNSMFANSALAAIKMPTNQEIKILENVRHQIPKEVYTKAYMSPKTDGSGRNRENLRKARKLLYKAGWRVVENKLIDKKGNPLTIEFLLYENSFQRIINPYIRNLKRLGIKSIIRIVDVANFQHRMQQFDFDVIIQRYIQTNTPGLELKTYFSSTMADVAGSRNLGGIKNSAVDYLITKVITAKSRSDLLTSVHALDRVLMWNHFMVPQWYKGVHNIAFWNKFSRPKLKPKFSLGVIDTWWYNKQKDALINSRKNLLH